MRERERERVQKYFDHIISRLSSILLFRLNYAIQECIKCIKELYTTYVCVHHHHPSIKPDYLSFSFSTKGSFVEWISREFARAVRKLLAVISSTNQFTRFAQQLFSWAFSERSRGNSSTAKKEKARSSWPTNEVLNLNFFPPDWQRVVLDLSATLGLLLSFLWRRFPESGGCRVYTLEATLARRKRSAPFASKLHRTFAGGLYRGSPWFRTMITLSLTLVLFGGRFATVAAAALGEWTRTPGLDFNYSCKTVDIEPVTAAHLAKDGLPPSLNCANVRCNDNGLSKSIQICDGVYGCSGGPKLPQPNVQNITDIGGDAVNLASCKELQPLSRGSCMSKVQLNRTVVEIKVKLLGADLSIKMENTSGCAYSYRFDTLDEEKRYHFYHGQTVRFVRKSQKGVVRKKPRRFCTCVNGNWIKKERMDFSSRSVSLDTAQCDFSMQSGKRNKKAFLLVPWTVRSPYCGWDLHEVVPENPRTPLRQPRWRHRHPRLAHRPTRWGWFGPERKVFTAIWLWTEKDFASSCKLFPSVS